MTLRCMIATFGLVALTPVGVSQPTNTIFNNADRAGLSGSGLITGPGPTGTYYSELQAPNISLGFNCNAQSYELCDDFDIKGFGAAINGVTVFAYVNAVSASTMFNGSLTVRADSVNGPIVANGTFVGASFSNVFRVASSTINLNRRVQEIRFIFGSTYLPPRKYWICYSLSHAQLTPFTPSLTQVGAPTTPGANAQQRQIQGPASNVVDGGGPQDFPFWIEGKVFSGGLRTYDISSRSIYRVFPSNGAIVHEATLPGITPSVGSMAYDWEREIIYMSSTLPHSLYRVTLDGSFTSIGGFNLGTPFVNGLEYHDDQDALYAVESNGNNRLLTINRTTGAATVIGSTGLTNFSFRNLCFVPDDGLLYLTDSSSDSLYVVNISTGLATLVGPLNGPSNPSGLTWNPEIGKIFLNEPTGDLWTVNRSTGASTLVGDMGSGSFQGLFYKGDEPLELQSVEIIEGTPFGGDLASLLNSDDNKFYVLNDETLPNADVRIDATYQSNNFRRLFITIESSASRDDLTEFVDLFNHNAQAFQTAGVSGVSLADSTRVYTVMGNQWGSPSKTVTTRIRTIPQADIETADGWASAVDRLHLRLLQ